MAGIDANTPIPSAITLHQKSRVLEIAFADGSRARRGQLLVQLDDTLQKAQLQQAEAQASIARTNLQRSRELLAQNFVSQTAVDTHQTALDTQLQRRAALAEELCRDHAAAVGEEYAGFNLPRPPQGAGDGPSQGARLACQHLDLRFPRTRVRQERPLHELRQRLLVRRETPPEVQERLHQWWTQAAADAEFLAWARSTGSDPQPVMSLAESRAFYTRDVARYTALLKAFPEAARS